MMMKNVASISNLALAKYQEKLLKFEAEGEEFANLVNTILKQNAFLSCSWSFLRSNTLEQL